MVPFGIMKATPPSSVIGSPPGTTPVMKFDSLTDSPSLK